MDVLVIGGTRFVGHLLVGRLLASGHRVTLLHRGRTPSAFAGSVEEILGDRTNDALQRRLGKRRFDATVDFAAYTGDDVDGVLDAGKLETGHYVLVSSGQVYLLRDPRPMPAREDDYDGPLMPRPDDLRDRAEYDYGAGKRGAEDTLANAWARHRFPYTALRLPMVNGERDYYRRIEGYLWRLLDGGPVLLPDGGPERCRHVYGRDVARTILGILGDERTFGRAFNLAHEEVVTVRELVAKLAGILGAPDRRVDVPVARIVDAGLHPKEVSPFSQRWMSFLDPSLAKEKLGFVATPLDVALECIVASFLAHPPPDRPSGYARRAEERALAATP